MQRDIALGKRLGVRGTPSFFIAITDREDPDKVRAVQFIPGAAPAETFRQLIEATLAKASEN